MGRYIGAATKISRTAVGSPDNRPVMQVYKVGYERRDIRRSEDMPFATHGGLAVRHTFPLDGEYLFAIRLKRNETIETIDGIAEDEHQIELRVDHALVRRFDDRRQVPRAGSGDADRGAGGRRRGPAAARIPDDCRPRVGDPSAGQPRARVSCPPASPIRRPRRMCRPTCPASTCSTSRDRSTGPFPRTRRAAGASSRASRPTAARRQRNPAPARSSARWPGAPTGAR